MTKLEFDLDLNVEDFAALFGVEVDQLPKDCKAEIADHDFRYRLLTRTERDMALLRVFQRIVSGELHPSGPSYLERWEQGWMENLEEYRRSGRLEDLLPKFVRKNEPVRLKGDYALPVNPNFETAFVRVLRCFLFQTWFREVPEVYEFGCGTGLNLLHLASLLPDRNLHGLDWSKAACNIVEELARRESLPIDSRRFDMFNPDPELVPMPESGLFTIGAMEQIGTDFDPFLDFVLAHGFSVCIHVETIYELYDKDVLFDALPACYLTQRNWLRGYLSRLQELEQDGRIEILSSRRTFGSFFHDGYTFTVWRPIYD